MYGKKVFKKQWKGIYNMQKVTTKLILKVFDEKELKLVDAIAVVYNWKKKQIKIGGKVRFEMLIRDISKTIFCGMKLEISGNRLERRNYKDRYVKTFFKSKIVFEAKCMQYQFKIGMKRLKEAQDNGGMHFAVVDTIGRMFN